MASKGTTAARAAEVNSSSSTPAPAHCPIQQLQKVAKSFPNPEPMFSSTSLPFTYQPMLPPPFPAYPFPDQFRLLRYPQQPTSQPAVPHRPPYLTPRHIVFLYWNRDLRTSVVGLPNWALPRMSNGTRLFRVEERDLTDYGWGPGVRVHEDVAEAVAAVEAQYVEHVIALDEKRRVEAIEELRRFDAMEEHYRVETIKEQQRIHAMEEQRRVEAAAVGRL